MRTVLTVASRELTERARSKAFIISNVVIVVAIAGAALIPSLLPEGEASEVAVFDDESRQVMAVAAEQDALLGGGVETLEVAHREEAEEALREGEAAAVLEGGDTLLVEGEPPMDLRGAVASAAQAVAIDRSLAELGLSASERQALLAQDPLTVESLGSSDGEDGVGQDEEQIIAFFAVMALYGLLIMYGQWVGQGIVEEKQSRVVEILLSTVTPLQLLAGKVVGIGLLGFGQILLIAGAGSLALLYALPFDLPPGTWGTIGLVLAWYVLGFAIYATLFAGVGAICARIEDFQSAATPVFFLIFAAIIGVQFALNSPDGTVAQVLGLVPFTAPLVQPMRASVGSAGPLEAVAAVGLGLLTVALLVPLAARLYSGGILKTRARVSLREAWSSGADA